MRPRDLEPVDGYEPLVGRFVAMLVDTRHRLSRDLEDLQSGELDRIPAGSPNSVGTLLYHIAAIELDWTIADLLESTSFPEGTDEWFPVAVREADWRLTPVVEPLERHLERLQWTRDRLLEALTGMSDEDLERIRVNPDDGQESGGSWILHHLMQHEAEHRGQIGEIRAALRA